MKQKTFPVPRIALAVLLALLLNCVKTHAEPKLYFVHSDHLGTPQVLTDENQTVVWKADYTPFGEATVDEDPDGDGVAVEFNLRFPGQYFDKETGTNYNYYRTYDPKLGRYIQSDPIGLAGGINTYGYVGGNPINFIDPYGLRGADAGDLIFFAVAAGAVAIAGVVQQIPGFVESVSGAVSDMASAAGTAIKQCIDGIAANEADYGDGGGGGPDCTEKRKALYKMFHAISHAEKAILAVNDPRLKETLTALKFAYKWEVKKFEKECGTYNDPPPFDDIYQN